MIAASRVKELRPLDCQNPIHPVILSEAQRSRRTSFSFFQRKGGKPRKAIGIARGTLAAIRLSWLFTLLLGINMAGASAQFPISRESLLNKPAPNFTRKDLNGASLDLASFHGKVILLNFWATWCGPCELEMPVFAQWQRQYAPQGFQVIGISMDDDPALARKLTAKLKLNYPSAMGDEKLGELYGGILGLPLTYLIDRNGIVRAKFQGETDPKTIQNKLQELLTQP